MFPEIVELFDHQEQEQKSSSRDYTNDIASTVPNTQRARVMLLNEIAYDPIACWLEFRYPLKEKILNQVVPVVIRRGTVAIAYISFFYNGGFMMFDYGKRVRCWTAKPTLELMEATNWND